MKKIIKNAPILLVLPAIVGASVLTLIFLITSVWIGFDVKQNCKIAQLSYPGNCTESLSQAAKNPDEPFEFRNSAIWSLGQLGNKSALPTLKELYTGVIPDREPYAKTLSQYELKKAIHLIEKGPNITSFVWKNNLILKEKSL